MGGSGQDLGDSVWPLLAALIPRAISVQVQNGVIVLRAENQQPSTNLSSSAPTLLEGYAFIDVDENEARKRKFVIEQAGDHAAQ